MMRVAISIPDPVFRSAEQLAKRLGVSRSELYSRAVRRFVDEHCGRALTERLNQIYGDSGVGSELETLLADMQSRAIERSTK